MIMYVLYKFSYYRYYY